MDIVYTQRELALMPFRLLINNKDAVLSLISFVRVNNNPISICEKSLQNYHNQIIKHINSKMMEERKYILLNKIYYVRQTGEHISNNNITDLQAKEYLRLGYLRKEYFERIPEPENTKAKESVKAIKKPRKNKR